MTVGRMIICNVDTWWAKVVVDVDIGWGSAYQNPSPIEGYSGPYIIEVCKLGTLARLLGVICDLVYPGPELVEIISVGLCGD